jgi:hypothetical protein
MTAQMWLLIFFLVWGVIASGINMYLCGIEYTMKMKHRTAVMYCVLLMVYLILLVWVITTL